MTSTPSQQRPQRSFRIRKEDELLKAQHWRNKDPTGFEKKPIDFAAGYGLFVTKSFENNEFLLNYRGKHSDEAPVSNYVYEYHVGSKSCFIDATAESSGLARYINDTDPFHKPNCKPVVTFYKNASTITFIAIRDINSGKSIL